MRITLIIYSLGSGGAERVLSTMADFWAGRGVSVTLLTFDDGSQPAFYALHPAVTHIALDLRLEARGVGAAGILRNYLGSLKRLRTAVRNSRPDVVISFLDRVNVISALSLLGSSIPLIVSERNNPAVILKADTRRWRLWSWLRRVSYGRARRLVLQTAPMLDSFPEALRRRAVVIPNPITLNNADPDPETDSGHTRPEDSLTMMAAGRLAPQKGFDLLLRAFVRVTESYPDWRLVVWGEGDERAGLEKLAGELNIRARVSFPGRTRHLVSQMQGADLFVLSSRFEGFPNVLGEAMACGLPVISFDCPTGPRDLIRDGIDGVLVPVEDVEGLAQAMDQLMGDPLLRHRLATRAPEVLDRFGLNQVMDLWDELISEVTQ